ncbi:retrovirus-related pol polyprotein from transposon TNT 1-94 [Tanacetum coccineum]
MFGSDTIKLDIMDGMNFTRWKEKMKFLLTAFKVYYVLEGPPVGVMTEEEQRKREQDETLCRGYILSTLTDRLYDLYTPMTSAREIWNSLEEKYTAEKEGADKFITFKFFEFAMEDNVSILDQVHEFLILVSKFKNLNIEIPEKLLVGAIITKLPSSWHNYRKKLMHTSEDFTLDQIQKHLRIEEETRIREKNLNGASSSKVNYVDSGKNNKGNDKKRKGTWNSSKDNKKDKKPLSEVVCYKCGEKGHIKRYCKNPKKKNQNSNKKDESANAVEQVDTTEITAMVSEMNIGMIQELHMASVTTTDDWWYDSGATTHVCNNRDLFKTYKETEDGHEVMMGDNHTSKVIGSGNVEIQFTSGKKLTLMNVLHVPNIRKNLVSGFKLCKSGVKAVIESDKVILSKANVFVGKAYTYVYLLKSKDQAFETFKIYKAEVENQKGKKIQILRSDRGGEYFSIEFSCYCESQGLIHQRTAPYTPQQNGVAITPRVFQVQARRLIHSVPVAAVVISPGTSYFVVAYFGGVTVAERKNRVLQDMINAIIIAKKLKVSPYEIWKGRKPNISYFRVWGCLAYYKVPLPNTSKLGPRGLKSVFVGYAKDSKSYRCLDLDSNVIVESRDVDFFENKFRHDSTSTNEIVTQIPQDISGPNLNSNNKRNMAESSSAPRRSERARKERNLDPDFIDSQAIIFLVEGDNENNVINKIPVLLNVEDAPKTYKEAITSRNSAFWKEAIDDEMDSLVSNNTWELSDLPPGSKAIGCRWVFRIKYHTDGSIQTFKARLVIQGFSQRQGVDYFDTYAPVARITSIRVLFALASIYNLPIHQMDVKTAFLNGDLDEEVYMKQPEGFVLPGHENKVCKLKKSLYGLKQAPKQWHDKFDKSILSNGFTHNSSDRCIYSKFTKDYGVILCLYVDDILIVGTNMEGINETKKFLSSCFQMKDMNEVDTILGIKVKRHSGGYALNQCHYIDKIIDKFQHLNIEEANTPYESSCKLVENNGRVVAQIEYASAIGCLMYATHCTRPDIAYAVCKLSRYTSNPSQDHWKAIGRVFGYLKRTRQLALYYDRFPAVLEGYSDASWITGSSDNKSTNGWIFTLGGGAVCWGSKKQTCITHSTMKTEFLALPAASKEAEWLRNMLLDIELWPQPMPAISLHCDSQSTLSRAYNKVYNGKSRHISLKHAYIKELISNGIITIEYIRSCKNLADPFTKGLSKNIVFGTTREMGLKPIE